MSYVKDLFGKANRKDKVRISEGAQRYSNNSADVKEEEKCTKIMKESSIYFRRFGIYLNNSTLYVNKTAMFCSYLTLLIFLILFTFYLMQVTSLEGISYYYQKLHDDTFKKYSVEIPTGDVSYINDTDVTPNKPMLFPLNIGVYYNLTCKDIEFTIFGPQDQNFGKMDCQQS